MSEMSETHDQLNTLEAAALAELNTVTSADALQAWYGRLFGTKRSKGALDEAMAALGSLPREARPAFGKRANEVKQALLAAHEARQVAVREAELDRALSSGAIDVTLPGAPVQRGRLHPSTQTLRRICAIFAGLGFEVYRSPDVETDANNPPVDPKGPAKGEVLPS